MRNGVGQTKQSAITNVASKTKGEIKTKIRKGSTPRKKKK